MVVAVEAMAVGEEEVTVTQDLLHVEGGKMAMAVMGRPKNAATAVANLGILLGNASPRSQARPT
jgi:hypothetical protein